MKSKEKRVLLDGLLELQNELKLTEIMRLIERTARWVDPVTFKILPVWFPEYARNDLFYRANWSEPQTNTNKKRGFSEHKREGNSYASKALTLALGLRSRDRPNWSCCHIWGVDDPKFQSGNIVVQDRRYYSCIANMVLLPTPLKAFTDTMSTVKAMLRLCSKNLYGWQFDYEGMGETRDILEKWNEWDAYPVSWPRYFDDKEPIGVMHINDQIRKDAASRLDRIRYDIQNAGPFYPRSEVLAVLSYWNIEV